MMLLIPEESPIDCVNYLLRHTNEKYLKVQIKELFQLICSAGYSDEFKKIPQGKAIQDWIKHNESFVWCYLNYALAKTYTNKNKGIPERYDRIFKDFTHNIKAVFGSSLKPKTAVFRYKKGYISLIPTNTELPLKQATREYQKYLQWKVSTNIKYFKGEVKNDKIPIQNEMY